MLFTTFVYVLSKHDDGEAADRITNIQTATSVFTAVFRVILG